MKERVVGGFNASKAVILMSRTTMAVEKRTFPKIPNWRHYLLKTRAKREKNWHNQGYALHLVGPARCGTEL